MTQDELDKILEAHQKWLNREKDGVRADLHDADLSGVNLRNADLSCAYLSNTNLSYANLSGADLYAVYMGGANLSHANLSDTNLECARLDCADLRYTNLSGANLVKVKLSRVELMGSNLSGAKGLLSVIDYMKLNFERVDDGYIVYKTFGGQYTPPENWEVRPGSVLTENVNFDRTEDCGCGILQSTLRA